MNALLSVFLILVLFGGERTANVAELIRRIDFASFRPVFNLLGVNEKTVDFLCSDEFSAAISNENFTPSALVKLLSSFSADRKAEKDEKTDDGESPSSAETENKLSPIESVAPEEIERSLSGFFS